MGSVGRITTFTRKQMVFWTNARGEEYDVSRISDEYLLNIIGYLAKKLRTLEGITFIQSKGINAERKRLKMDIITLTKELDLREVQNRHIGRCEGEEEYYKDYA